MGVPSTSRSTSTAVPADMDSNVVRGIASELSQDYKEAVKLLTRAIEDEHGDVIKLALAHRFRGLAYKHLGRRD